MYLARIRRTDADGDSLRIVAAVHPNGPWIDVRTAYQRRLERHGATSEAARRLAAALVPSSMTAALSGGDAFLDAVNAELNDKADNVMIEGEVTYAAPIDPVAFRDYMVFEEHFTFGAKLKGEPVPAVLYEFPVSYMGSVQGIIGPGDEVPWPHHSDYMDYELELGIVIGRGGRDIAPEHALDHVAGLTAINDFSAREIQLREMAAGLGPCKAKHFATAVGPIIASLDVLPVQGLQMVSRVNGDEWCTANSSTMLWSIAEIVAWTSAGEYLAPGTLIGTGTVGGGSGIETGRRLHAGDVVELELEGIGILRNTIGARGTGWLPPHRERPAADGDSRQANRTSARVN
jgi:2-keto-4-pentenoate hydratase/2-oxohepta-3-ene-1,7-dioic acid hydratase in catechol pathway